MKAKKTCILFPKTYDIYQSFSSSNKLKLLMCVSQRISYRTRKGWRYLSKKVA